MGWRWYICPVVDVLRTHADGTEDSFRAAKIATHIEPVRGKYYQYASAIDAGGYCLCVVKATDFSVLEADAEIINLTEMEFDDPQSFLDMTPQQLGWSNARMLRIRNRLTARGIDTTGLTATSTIEEILDRVCRAINDRLRARRIRVG